MNVCLSLFTNSSFTKRSEADSTPANRKTRFEFRRRTDYSDRGFTRTSWSLHTKSGTGLQQELRMPKSHAMKNTGALNSAQHISDFGTIRYYTICCATSQAFNFHLFTAEAWIQSSGYPCGICCEQRGMRQFLVP